MLKKLRAASPLLCIIVVHLMLLAQGAMLGCGFTGRTPVDPIDDNMDNPNFYTCACHCVAPVVQSMRVSAAFDDAEQTQLIGDTDGAGDLDLSVVPVGVRFANLAIPPGAVITSAALQFTADQGFAGDNTTPVNLDVFAEAADNAPSFGSNFANVTGLPRTGASIGWIAPAWTINQSGPAQRTPDMRLVIQEVVGRPGWRSGNALVVILAGAGGRREAESFDGNPARAVVLELQFTAATDQALDVCMPDYLNPNLLDDNMMQQPNPSNTALQTDCAERVHDTLEDLAMACHYPAPCVCVAELGSRRFNATCNDPCAAVPLDPSCSNFDPRNGNTTATNVPGDPHVCVASRDAAHTGPSALTSAMFGQVSECQVDGPATLSIGDEDKSTQAHGTVEFSGEPCPGAQCALGVAYKLDLDPITFSVRFATDPVFADLATSGASALAAAVVGPAGIGQVDAQNTESSVRGRRQGSSNTKAYSLSNPDAIGVIIDWSHHTCALFGNLAGSVDAEDGAQGLSAEVSVSGTLLNQPPHADAGQDQIVECTSPAGATVVLDGRASSDPDGNLALLSWSHDSRIGSPAGSGARVELPQAIGIPATYVLRAVDEFGQTDEDAATVRVVDTTAPTLSLSVAPAKLWPVSQKLVTVNVTLGTGDGCDPSPTIRLRSIASNEGQLADGNGHSSMDIQGAAFGTDDRQFQLRARRSTGGNGRIYTITYDSVDGGGNATQRVVTVTVPKTSLPWTWVSAK